MTKESPYKGRPGEEASGGKSRKEVYVYPLAKRCREVLRNGPPPVFAPQDAFVRLWGNVIGTVVRVSPMSTTGSGSSAGGCSTRCW